MVERTATRAVEQAPWRRRVGLGVAFLLATSVAVSWIVRVVSPPHERIAPDGAAAWSIELTALGNAPVSAFIWGEEAGIHLVRIPVMTAGPNASRVIAARLGRGELHMVSLGRAGLRARAVAPAGAPAGSWRADGHVITAFQTSSGTGVRTWW